MEQAPVIQPRDSMESLCRFCGFQEHVARQFRRGCEHNASGHEYVEINPEQIGPVGPGTPAARMRWLWEELDKRETLLTERGGYNPFSSRGTIEQALLRVLDGVRAMEQEPTP